jgi:hypothetical protein
MRAGKVTTWVLALIALVAGLSILGYGSNPSEYEVKAAFILNFAKFVSWPDSAFEDDSAAFVIGIANVNPFNGNLREMVIDKTVNGRKIIIVPGVSKSDAASCHLLFIGQSDESNIEEWLDTVAGEPILTVGESESFGNHDGMIRFVIHDKTVRFKINLKSAEKAGLKMSAKLLKVALEVKQ